MMPDLRTILAQVVASISQPREIARWVMSFKLSRMARWEVLLLVVVLSVIAAHGTIAYIMRTEASVMGLMALNPWTTAIVQMSVLVLAVFAVFWVGRAMGGTGDFGDTILLMAWLQFCLLCLQVVQTVFMFLLPPVASLLGIAGIVLFFWLLANFVAELHGFTSLGRVFAMIVVTILTLVFALSIILTLIGITVPGAPVHV